VLSSEGEAGNFRELINAKVKEPMEALVNPAMVLDVLRKVPGEYVAVAQEGPLKPIFVRGISDFGISIVMPIRRREAARREELEGDF
jgi:DNA polymerase III sliding clamp (beta) subunit (PCNA family)